MGRSRGDILKSSELRQVLYGDRPGPKIEDPSSGEQTSKEQVPAGNFDDTDAPVTYPKAYWIVEEWDGYEWRLLIDFIGSREDAQAIAHHEQTDSTPIRIRSRKFPDKLYTLAAYAGEDAADLRKTWVDASSPDYSDA